MMPRGTRWNAVDPEQGKILVERLVRRDPRRENGAHDEQQHEGKARDGARVATQPVPRVRPEAARPRDPNLDCLELRDGHQPYRILGLMIAYEMSTSRLTRTKTTATNMMPPCRTG